MQPDSLFRIASVTKPIGAALTLMLIKDGALPLDDPVERYVPELPGEATVRHLLTFTSGWASASRTRPRAARCSSSTSIPARSRPA